MNRIKSFKNIFALLLCGSIFVVFPGCEYIEIKPTPPPNPAGPEMANALLQLINSQETQEIDASDYESTSLHDLIMLGTPAGYRIQLRYTELSISLTEALKTSRDKNLLDRMFELAQWSNRDRVRAEALITVGSFSDPNDIGYIQAALGDQNSAGIRLAAIEALQMWGLPAGREILRRIMSSPWSPTARVLAARAALTMGDSTALAVLRQLIRDRSWIIRAMAAHALGDFGESPDFNMVLTALNQETQNDFVMAEMSIAALKLLAKADPKVSFVPGVNKTEEGDVSYQIRGGVVEMAPLVLVPPRLYISDSKSIAQSINNKLLDLIQRRLDVPLDEASKNDPNLQDLYRMLTPFGFALQTRYSKLSVLVAEGLAGTFDPFLRAKLTQLAEGSSNSSVRSTALLSLAYRPSPEDERLFVDGLNSQDPIVRFGAMEAVQVAGFKQFIPDIISIATNDSVPAFRLFAIQLLLRLGDPNARNLLLNNTSQHDWPARAMTYWYLGRYGLPEDFSQIRNQIASEKNPFVLSEIILAAQRLAPL